MVKILVSPDQLLDVAGRFLSQRQELEKMCDRLDKQIYFIREGWSGATRERFFQEYLVGRQSMGVTMEQISSIAQQLNFIARNFAEADGEGGSSIVMPSLPPETEAKLKSTVDSVASAGKGVEDTLEGLFDDAVGVGKSFLDNPFGTVHDIAYGMTIGKVVDIGIGARFAWDFTWGTGKARADYDQFVEKTKQGFDEKGAGYYSGYALSQAAVYFTVGKALRKSEAKHDDLGGSGEKSEGIFEFNQGDGNNSPLYVPKDENGNPLALPKTDGKMINGTVHIPESVFPHTQIGWQKGRKGNYIQTLEWGENGVPINRKDWTDHGRSQNHTNPHDHPAVFQDGSWSFK